MGRNPLGNVLLEKELMYVVQVKWVQGGEGPNQNPLAPAENYTCRTLVRGSFVNCPRPKDGEVTVECLEYFAYVTYSTNPAPTTLITTTINLTTTESNSPDQSCLYGEDTGAPMESAIENIADRGYEGKNHDQEKTLGPGDSVHFEEILGARPSE
ncbi:hypothetical protein BDV12DRAFT_204052 [Aspergillus spectabilis]